MPTDDDTIICPICETELTLELDYRCGVVASANAETSSVAVEVVVRSITGCEHVEALS